MNDTFLWWMLLIPLLAGPITILAYAVTLAFIGALDSLTNRINPPAPPFCNIDPLCHPAFLWAKDGSGWIGPVCVFPTAQ